MKKEVFLIIEIFLLIMTIGELLFQCDNETKNIFRKYEQINKKIIESKWSKNFNEICLNEDLWPTYTNFITNENLNLLELGNFVLF